MSIDDEKILRLMARGDAMIDTSVPGRILPAYPKGNRRRKPLFWIENSTLSKFLSAGILQRKSNMAALSDDSKRRFGRPEMTGQAGQHRDLETRDIYTPCGAERPAQVNHRTSALRALARKRNAAGEPILTPAQVEAGEHFARDYNLGGLGYVATQNYDYTGADNTSGHGAQEAALITRMDRRRRINEAISCLGPGLDRALIAVCCEDWSIEHLERTEKWSRHSGRTVLGLALDRLVVFYGTQPGYGERRA